MQRDDRNPFLAAALCANGQRIPQADTTSLAELFAQLAATEQPKSSNTQNESSLLHDTLVQPASGAAQLEADAGSCVAGPSVTVPAADPGALASILSQLGVPLDDLVPPRAAQSDATRQGTN